MQFFILNWDLSPCAHDPKAPVSFAITFERGKPGPGITCSVISTESLWLLLISKLCPLWGFYIHTHARSDELCWILCLWLPPHLLPSAGCFCNCSTLNQWVICDQWVKQLRIQLGCCDRLKPLQQVLFDVPRSAGCGVTAKVKHSSSVFRCQTTKRHRSTALQTFYRFLKV